MAESSTMWAPASSGDPDDHDSGRHHDDDSHRAVRWLRRRAAVLSLVGQLLLLGTLFWLYRLARHLADGHPRAAMSHAVSVWRWERSLRIPDESFLQRWALHWDGWVRPANVYYVSVHFPMTGLFLAWTWWRHRDAWPRMRAVIISLTAVALVVQVLYPLAPPRLLHGTQILDTMARYGPDAYGAVPGEGMANQYAAMPSLHVGWALLVAWGVVRYSRSPVRWLAVAHPVVTTLVVVFTGNHYWFDGAVGATLAVGAVATVTSWQNAAWLTRDRGLIPL